MKHDRIATASLRGTPLRRLATRLAWPGLMLASLSLYGATTGILGLTPELAVQVQFFVLFVAIVAVERLAPYHPEWNRYDRQSLNDFGYNFLFPAAQFIATSAALWITGLVVAGNGSGAFGLLASTPLVLQVVVFALIADLFYYVYHRLFHEVDQLWNFHAVHHSSLSLHILNNARVHPLEVFVAFFPIVAAAYLLQVPPDVLGWFLVLQLATGLLTHSNVAVKNGWESWVFNTPELHHWHHSRALAEQNNNYASTLMVWDQLFGTYHNPRERQASRHIGTGTPIPRALRHQILFPFHPNRDFGDPANPPARSTGETS